MTDTFDDQQRPRRHSILVDLRPAFDGYSGIPQECRLLFWALSEIDTLEVTGLLHKNAELIGPGASAAEITRGKFNHFDRYSRTVISMTSEGSSLMFFRILSGIFRYSELVVRGTVAGLLARLGARTHLKSFSAEGFEDFIWRTLFAKTLQAKQFPIAAKSKFRILSLPWEAMHQAGLIGRSLNLNKYLSVDTRDADYLVVHTPFPGTCSRNTRMIVRYHDAIPVLMPHTIQSKLSHQASHFNALRLAVTKGAYFACVSEATRADLLRMFPEVESRTTVIHNMVSHHYFQEDSKPERVSEIVRGRITPEYEPEFLTSREKDSFYQRNLPGAGDSYLLMVSTIEPRKNHSRLLAAWEYLRAHGFDSLKLVIVGGAGWDCEFALRLFKPWQNRGQLFLLDRVPSSDLRVLYRHAAVTVCPSLGEGFDYSGVEAMRSNGVVAASDIPVHREVYDNAARYFNPYSTGSLAESLEVLMRDQTVRQQLKENGQQVSARYLPENIIPKWKAYLESIQAGPAS